MVQPSGSHGAPWFSTLIVLMHEQGGAMDVSDSELQRLSPLALAYVGDAVYELFVRSCYLLPSKRIRAYHQQVVHHVRAEQQCYYLELLKPYLSEAEETVARRGRNAASHRKQRASTHDYQQATALEALLGYLYLTDPQRLLELLGHLPTTHKDLQEPLP